MKNHRVGLNVEKIGFVEFDVSEETFKKFSKYCIENYPDKNWRITKEDKDVT